MLTFHHILILDKHEKLLNFIKNLEKCIQKGGKHNRRERMKKNEEASSSEPILPIQDINIC